MLAQLNKRNIRSRRPRTTVRQYTDDFDKGKNSREENSKIRFDEFDRAINLVFDNRDVIPRKGTLTFTSDADFLDIAISKNSGGNKLYAFKKDTTNTKLVDINRDTKAQTDLITGVAGQANFSYDSSADTFYFCNGTAAAVQVWQAAGTATTLAIPAGTPVALTMCANRLWVADDDNNLHYSQKTDGEVTSFTINNAHNTGGITTTDIDKIVEIDNSGVYVVVMGKQRFEIHTAPQFTGGETTFGDAPDTYIAGFDGYGIESMKGYVIVGGVLYFQMEGNFYRYLIGSQTTPEPIDRNKGEHLKLGFNRSAMYYNPDEELIYTSCRKNSVRNNYGIFYKVRSQGDSRYNAFSNFTNINAFSFAGDKDDVFFLQEYGGTIKTIEGTDDDGADISCELRSANVDNGDVQYRKNIRTMYLNAESDGSDDIYYYFWADSKDNTENTPQFTFVASITASPPDMLGTFGPWGLTPWGLSAYSTEGNDTREFVWQEKKVNRAYGRGMCGIRFSTRNNVRIKGVGWDFTRTIKRVGNKEFL